MVASPIAEVNLLKMEALKAISLPPGFGFHPTDVELISHYLKRKNQGLKVDLEVIPELAIYEYEPWDLPGNYLSFFLSKIVENKGMYVAHDLGFFFFFQHVARSPQETTSGTSLPLVIGSIEMVFKQIELLKLAIGSPRVRIETSDLTTGLLGRRRH